ncbi:Cofilin [Neolecta irregularis DAH-3]|uniref:Cofilin n=1 Tax=Neolecta irregularis (strain DAH-3) TaxID=1198029 RepID=A0A1U7LH37_NEOID|nr:Cofilin [Neolecta irregularis DAH-3]|eukprot:OLL21970.1 Cofilin [Neolecta irregularis DAH-3]
MARSGVSVDKECNNAFQDLKLGKKFHYVIFKLDSDAKNIVVDKIGAKSSEEKASKMDSKEIYEEFIEHLPETDCRYAIYDFQYVKSAEEGFRSKIVFIAWSPDESSVKSKMVYASSKEILRTLFSGVGVELQATALDEVDYASVLEKCNRGN